MNRIICPPTLTTLLTCAGLSLPATALAAPQYNYIDLQAYEVIALNNAGQVLGLDKEGYFLWKAGRKTHLGNLIAPFCTSDPIWPGAMNDAGQVVGDAGNCAVLTDGVNKTTLGSLGTSPSGWGNAAAHAINNKGQVVGASWYYTPEHVHNGTRAFLWQGGAMTNLGTLSEAPLGVPSYAYSSGDAINEAGQVLGTSRTDSGAYVGVVWTQGTMKPHGLNEAYAINNAGQVIGYAYFSPTLFWHAAQYDGQQLIDLGVLGAPPGEEGTSRASAINDAGQVVGFSDFFASDGALRGVRAFLWEDGTKIKLGTQGSDENGMGWSWAKDINEAGEVVGFALAYNDAHEAQGERAFYWADGEHYNLNKLTVRPADTFLVRATAIKD
jgi:probable HAF family extracellular repeat protein